MLSGGAAKRADAAARRSSAVGTGFVGLVNALRTFRGIQRGAEVSGIRVVSLSFRGLVGRRADPGVPKAGKSTAVGTSSTKATERCTPQGDVMYWMWPLFAGECWSQECFDDQRPVPADIIRDVVAAIPDP